MNMKKAGDYLEANFIRYENNHHNYFHFYITKNKKITVCLYSSPILIINRDPRFSYIFNIKKGLISDVTCHGINKKSRYCKCNYTYSSIKKYNQAHKIKKIQRRKLRRNKR